MCVCVFIAQPIYSDDGPLFLLVLFPELKPNNSAVVPLNVKTLSRRPHFCRHQFSRRKIVYVFCRRCRRRRFFVAPDGVDFELKTNGDLETSTLTTFKSCKMYGIKKNKNVVSSSNLKKPRGALCLLGSIIFIYRRDSFVFLTVFDYETRSRLFHS